MAVLSIRNLPEKVRAKLRIKAAKAGHSMEAEARAIITAACSRELEPMSPKELQAVIDKLWGDRPRGHVVDDFIATRRQESGE